MKAKGEGAVENKIVSIINSMDMNLSKVWEIVEDSTAWYAGSSPWSQIESHLT